MPTIVCWRGASHRLVITPVLGYVARISLGFAVRFAVLVSELELTQTLHPFAVAIMALLAVMALRDLALHQNCTGLLFLAAAHCVLYIALFLPQMREMDSVFQSVVE